MPDRFGWLRYTVRPLVLAAMAGVVALALARVALILAPTWQSDYVLPLMILVVIEAHLSHLYIKNNQLRGVEIIRYRLAEVVLIFFVVRLAPYFTTQGLTRLGEVQGWGLEPQQVLFNPETWIVFIIGMLFWQSITATLNDFDKIDGPVKDELPHYSLTAVHHDQVAYRAEYAENVGAHQSLLGRFLQAGVLLLMATGLSQVAFTSLLDFDRPPVGGVFAPLAFYFIAGLVMVGLLRFSTLRRRWNVAYVTVDKAVGRSWFFYLLVLVAVAALVAFLLPTGYSLPLLGGIALIIQGIFTVLAFIGLFALVVISFPVIWLIWWLSSFFGNDQPAPVFTPPAPPPMLAPPGAEADWAAFVRAAILWGILAVMLYFTFRTYFRDKEFSNRYPRLASWLERIRGWWDSLLAWWREGRRYVVSIFQQPRDPAPQSATIARPRRIARPHPSQNAVIELYLRFLRRAQTRGISRQVADTPYEFDDRVTTRVPDVETDVRELTHAFVAARYSDQPLDDATVARTKAAWQRLRERLREEETAGDDKERKGTAGTAGARSEERGDDGT